MTHKTLLTFILATTILGGFSQKRSPAFAITGQANGNFSWTDIRGIDMATGDAGKVFFENGKTKFSFRDAATNKTVDQLILKGNLAKAVHNNTNLSSNSVVLHNITPTSLMSAAVAYDKKHGKLFFASMHTGSLMWLDLRSDGDIPSFYTVEKKLVTIDDYNNEALNITRMAIGADGYGYALTNDGKHLIKFSTGEKVIITDLGSLMDAETNNSISIHNQCSSWGGDIVADAFGKLYLFTAFQNIFEIDIQSRVATHKGKINKLPAAFSLNGAAVDDDENVIVSSANTFEGFYKINMKDLSAEKLNTKGQVFNASDLASSNLLNQKLNKSGIAILRSPEMLGNKFITIYPNPISNGQVKISFENNSTGRYSIQLTDLQGRLIENKTVYVKSPQQTENFILKTKPVKGMYLIQITDASHKNIYADKLVLE